MAQDRSYDDDEVRAIIDRALQARPSAGVSHEDLLAIGAGVGLSASAIENAAIELRASRQNQRAVQRVVSKRRRGVAAHAFVFMAVNALLFVINWLTTPGEWWSLFPIFGWGLGLVLHAGFALGRGISPQQLQAEKGQLPQLPA
jgi:2TM domain